MYDTQVSARLEDIGKGGAKHIFMHMFGPWGNLPFPTMEIQEAKLVREKLGEVITEYDAWDLLMRNEYGL
jgi:hypothetical protein